MKKIVIVLIIGIIIGSSIGVFAYNYKSENVTYTPSDSNWNVNNVKDAIDELKVNNGNIKEVLFIVGTNYSSFGYSFNYNTKEVKRADDIDGEFIKLVYNASNGYSVYAKVDGDYYYANSDNPSDMQKKHFNKDEIILTTGSLASRFGGYIVIY